MLLYLSRTPPSHSLLHASLIALVRSDLRCSITNFIKQALLLSFLNDAVVTGRTSLFLGDAC